MGAEKVLPLFSLEGNLPTESTYFLLYLNAINLERAISAQLS